ncbi:acylamino-acid-releasing enzyme-like isoform X2 [Chrysoperla carnea]|uniref:acylamino-acid-releasing enzyme-like isoform X2 n=1 Tax=Chrysoperla carnea TaxID=189513 RepID=UPI001D091918|nr:acylamino-acid-releasing enzyme-like isoform X2 [Chrysoperla carnea]
MDSKDINKQANKVVDLFRKFAVIPTLVNGKVFLKNNSTPIIHSTWTQRNLETGTKNKFKKFFLLDSTTPIEISTTDVSRELLCATSPSRKYTAILRDDQNSKADKQILEIWDEKSMFRTVDLAALDLHGNVYTDGEFYTFEFSPCEKKLVYVAEAKAPKTEAYYKRKPVKDPKSESKPEESEPIKGDEYVYRQEWGEQLVGKIQSVICIYDIENDNVTILKDFPENLCPGQVHWEKNGNGFFGVAINTVPRKLGLIFCTNRPSEIFYLDKEGIYNRISNLDNSVRSPRLHPNGKYLYWLERLRDGPHHSCEALMKLELPYQPQTKPQVIIEIVDDVKQLKNSKNFYGIYSHDLPNRCFSKDGRQLIFSTSQQTEILSYILDLESNELRQIILPNYPNYSQTVLDVNDDLILFQVTNIKNPDILVFGKLSDIGENGELKSLEIQSYGIIPEIHDFKLENLEFKQNNDDAVTEFNGIYFGPKEASNASTPLILYIHGGPHSNFVNSYALSLALHASLGFATLLVNYRGSTGTGQKSVYFLPSRVGQADVEDCVLATKECVQKYTELDPKRVGLVGGSHGGFLVTHLSGQYPDLYRTVVARNPVIDIASMYIVSDIPDWCSVEAGTSYTQVGPISESLMIKQRTASPLVHAHNVKIPTLLLIGSKDLRVPPSQGVEFYHRLKANGVDVRMHMYEDNHSLSKVPVEFDSQVKGMLWLLEHTS